MAPEKHEDLILDISFFFRNWKGFLSQSCQNNANLLTIGLSPPPFQDGKFIYLSASLGQVQFPSRPEIIHYLKGPNIRYSNFHILF